MRGIVGSLRISLNSTNPGSAFLFCISSIFRSINSIISFRFPLFPSMIFTGNPALSVSAFVSDSFSLISSLVTIVFGIWCVV